MFLINFDSSHIEEQNLKRIPNEKVYKGGGCTIYCEQQQKKWNPTEQ